MPLGENWCCATISGFLPGVCENSMTVRLAGLTISVWLAGKRPSRVRSSSPSWRPSSSWASCAESLIGRHTLTYSSLGRTEETPSLLLRYRRDRTLSTQGWSKSFPCSEAWLEGCAQSLDCGTRRCALYDSDRRWRCCCMGPGHHTSTVVRTGQHPVVHERAHVSTK